jgi:hypothetical protein
MRRALAWVTGIVGVAALARLLHHRRHAVAVAPPETVDPADELRRTLADRREAEAEPIDPPTEEEAAAAGKPSLDERRAAVHARAEEAIAQMREDAPE